LTLALSRRVRVASVDAWVCSADKRNQTGHHLIPNRDDDRNPRSEPPASGRCPFGGRLGSGRPLRVPTRQREGLSGWEAPPAGGCAALSVSALARGGALQSEAVGTTRVEGDAHGSVRRVVCWRISNGVQRRFDNRWVEPERAAGADGRMAPASALEREQHASGVDALRFRVKLRELGFDELETLLELACGFEGDPSELDIRAAGGLERVAQRDDPVGGGARVVDPPLRVAPPLLNHGVSWVLVGRCSVDPSFLAGGFESIDVCGVLLGVALELQNEVFSVAGFGVGNVESVEQSSDRAPRREALWSPIRCLLAELDEGAVRERRFVGCEQAAKHVRGGALDVASHDVGAVHATVGAIDALDARERRVGLDVARGGEVESGPEFFESSGTIRFGWCDHASIRAVPVVASTLRVRTGGAREQWAPDQAFGAQLRGMSAESGAAG